MHLGYSAQHQQLRKVGDWLSEELANEIVALAEQRRGVGHVRRPLDPGDSHVEYDWHVLV
jgi:hypothetical protein